ncbi:MAG TPA: hypothetical protein VGW39_06465 [Chthoniobacterales bacterium]|nr:hypothetical protein [Chthoniobacterales bacterium]
MNKPLPVADVLRKYVDAEDQVLEKIALELALRPADESIAAAKRSILKQLELHAAAEDAVEEEVMRFREQLYVIARSIAERDMENKIITASHVLRARHEIWPRRAKYNFYDGYLAVGGILAGAGAGHLIDIANGRPGNVWLVALSLVGALLLGMGIVGKAKGG